MEYVAIVLGGLLVLGVMAAVEAGVGPLVPLVQGTLWTPSGAWRDLDQRVWSTGPMGGMALVANWPAGRKRIRRAVPDGSTLDTVATTLSPLDDAHLGHVLEDIMYADDPTDRLRVLLAVGGPGYVARFIPDE